MSGSARAEPSEVSASLGGIRLEARRLDVRLTRAAVKARLFRRAPQAIRIGRFVVLERVGMGGMGIVYAAYDPQLDRRVALKVMRDDVVRSRRPRQQKQLLQEARAMAKLSHPNVVAIYDAGTAEDQVFVAMEFVQSQTLRVWMAEEPSTEEIIRVFVESGRGLAAAHAVGLVHRDFKPENVLVPDSGSVRVTDFGLARAALAEDPAVSAARWRQVDETATGFSVAIAGTPAYMAPEQMRGEPIDARVDQWAFCLALYEAFVGHRPYGPPELQALACGEVVPLPPLPDGVVVPPAVREVIERGLSYAPGDRWCDMEAVLARLHVRRGSRRVVLLTIAGLGLCAAAAVALTPRQQACLRATSRMSGVWDSDTRGTIRGALAAASTKLGASAWARASPIVDRYVEQWLDLREGSCRAADEGELSAELLDLRMACLDSRHAELAALADTLVDADPVVVAHAVESAAGLTPLESCVDPKMLRELIPAPAPLVVREASLAIRGGVKRARALRRAGKATAASTEIGAAVQDALHLDEPVALVEALLERGRIRAELADREGAAGDFDAVIERGAGSGYLTAVAEASVALVDLVGVDLARHDAGLDLARMAAVAVALGGNEPLRRAQLKLARGRVLYSAGRSKEGVVATREGLAMLARPEATPHEQLERAAALRLMAKLALAGDEPERTTTLATEALAVFEGLLGEDHPQVAATLAHLAAASLRTGRPLDARSQFERAAEIQRGAYGPDHPAYGRTLANLGSTARATGDSEGALAQYRKAAQILEASLGPIDPRVASLWVNIGGVEADLGRLDEAESSYERGLAGLLGSVGEKHPQTALTLANLSRLELTRGHFEAARRTAKRSLAIRNELLGRDHVETGRSEVAVADIEQTAENFRLAAALYQTAVATLRRAGAPAIELAQVRMMLAAALVRDGKREAARALVDLAKRELPETDAASLARWCQREHVCQQSWPQTL